MKSCILRLTDYVFWLTSPLLQFGVSGAMVQARYGTAIIRTFSTTPFCQVVSEPVLVWLSTSVRSDSLYFYAYYLNIALSVLLSFAVLQEIFKDAFRPYEALRDLSVILFRWSASGGFTGRGNVGHHSVRRKTDNGAIIDCHSAGRS